MATRHITTPIFRASYINLFEPKKTQSGGWAYEITMIFNAEQEAELAEMLSLYNEAIQERYGNNPPATGVISPFRRGLMKTPQNPSGFDLTKYPEYEGKIVVAARSYTDQIAEGKWDTSKRPGLCGPDPAAIFDPHNNPADRIYSGMYARAQISMYCPKNGKGDPRVAVGLHNVQKCYDGEPLGTGTNQAPEKAFAVFVPPSHQGNHADLLGGQPAAGYQQPVAAPVGYPQQGFQQSPAGYPQAYPQYGYPQPPVNQPPLTGV